MRIGLAGVGRIGAFHAATLTALDGVDELVVADQDSARAQQAAGDLGAVFVPDAWALLTSGVDGLVIATATPGHAPLLRAAVAAGIPTFCEKPVAATLTETVELTHLVEASGVPVQVGFQRRFDAGYQRARAAVASGALGTIHAVRAVSHDRTPPHPEFIPQSGGIFRDLAVHDVDIVRFVTGQEVSSVSATGANKGAELFAAAGDVDTAAAILTLADGTLVTATATRYSGQGHDVRMEVMGSDGAVAVGLDDTLALRSVETGATFPTGPPHTSFIVRFVGAYRAELAAFLHVAAGQASGSPTVRDALEATRVAEACEVSRAERRTVDLEEIPTA